jgi:hypothetical protein
MRSASSNKINCGAMFEKCFPEHTIGVVITSAPIGEEVTEGWKKIA